MSIVPTWYLLVNNLFRHEIFGLGVAPNGQPVHLTVKAHQLIGMLRRVGVFLNGLRFKSLQHRCLLVLAQLSKFFAVHFLSEIVKPGHSFKKRILILFLRTIIQHQPNKLIESKINGARGCGFWDDRLRQIGHKVLLIERYIKMIEVCGWIAFGAIRQ